MKIAIKDPPREYEVGRGERITLKDCGEIRLEANEQITLKTESGAEYDVARKSWGFYATPSLNGRLASFGLHAVLVKSPAAKYYVFLVERGKEQDFQRYLDLERHSIVSWLDDDAVLAELDRRMTAIP